MDPITKFLHSISYKFPKGYPDINDEQDVILLENILSSFLKENIVFENFNKPNSIKAAEDFVQNSDFAKSNDVKRFSSSKYANRISSSKEKDLDKIESALMDHFGLLDSEIEFIEAGTGPAAKDSMPGFKLNTEEFGEIFISVSTSRKGVGGKQNEKNFNTNINAYASDENPITVKLISPDKTVIVDEVAKAVDVAGGTQNKLKADTALLNSGGSKIANISIKQPEGFRWASLNNDNSPFRKNFIEAAFNNPDFPITLKPNPEFPDKERYLMYKEGTDERVTLVIVTDAPYSADQENIFGTDDPKTIVVGKTFKPEDFEFDENSNTLTIKVNHIYENMDEIEGTPFEPVFIVAQHSGNPYGLDFRSYPSFMAKLPKKGTGMEIKYSDIVK